MIKNDICSRKYIWNLIWHESLCLLMLQCLDIFSIFFRALIRYVKSDTAYPWQGYMWAILLFSVTIIKGIILQMFFHGRNVTFVRVGAALMAAVYRKVGLFLLFSLMVEK